MIENFQPKTDRNSFPVWVIVAWEFWAIVLLAGCLLAKYYLLHAQYVSGVMGTPKSTLPGLIFIGLAMAAPFQSASLLSWLPGSLFRRIAAVSLWMVLVIVATKIGNSAYSELDTPMVFRPVLISMFPLIVLGFCVPFAFH